MGMPREIRDYMYEFVWSDSPCIRVTPSVPRRLRGQPAIPPHSQRDSSEGQDKCERIPLGQASCIGDEVDEKE